MAKKKTKRLAVIASGWHFPSQFYEAMARQKTPKGWKVELFCVAHRDPEDARKEKEGKVFVGPRAYLDKKLYEYIPTVEQIKSLGWDYVQEPNTVGDWGNTNQWIDKHELDDYDLILATHDDNLILSDNWLSDVIENTGIENWSVCANTIGMPEGWIRGSCEFFKPWVIRKMGGKFDLSETTLTREGETTATEDIQQLYDWNKTVDPIMRTLDKYEVPRIFLSPGYRVSCYVIEGERGYMSNTHGANTEREDVCLDYLKKNGVI